MIRSGYFTRLVAMRYETYREHPGEDFAQCNTHGSMRVNNKRSEFG